MHVSNLVGDVWVVLEDTVAQVESCFRPVGGLLVFLVLQLTALLSEESLACLFMCMRCLVGLGPVF